MSMEKHDSFLRFLRDGYVVQHKLLAKDQCDGLMAQILSDWRIPERSCYVHQKKFRIHAASEWNELTRSAVRTICKQFSGLIHSFLLENDPWLVELASISVFPGAKQQHLHRDHDDPRRKILTCFLNLMDIDDNGGPLFLVPGYQHGAQSNLKLIMSGQRPAGVKMILPAGSCVLMDGSLPHCGLANTSRHSIRPVFYFSLGDPSIDGPTYGTKPVRLSTVLNHGIGR